MNPRCQTSNRWPGGLWGILALFLSLNMAGPMAAGTIHGTIHAEGKPGAEGAASDGLYSSRKYKFAERINYAELRDFVVYIDGPAGTNVPAAPGQPVLVETRRNITQQGARFNPRLLPVVVGTTVEWPNHDEIFHNVFSISDAKSFDLGLYKHPELKRVTFDRPGRVDAFCSIHGAMHCIILVLENPYFSTTDAQGRYSLTNIPPGHYRLKAWHERLPSQVRDVTVAAEGQAREDFTLGIVNLPKY